MKPARFHACSDQQCVKAFVYVVAIQNIYIFMYCIQNKPICLTYVIYNQQLVNFSLSDIKDVKKGADLRIQAGSGEKKPARRLVF
ncbi:hypothetical protein TUM12370_32240 [Salmonella enterica subsp. enterica serovar Choleraesuis]|nr:hypothetical protein TUM12370_32240 [Salmonella enterica subsp. enterica serovar Choleraesuis]